MGVLGKLHTFIIIHACVTASFSLSYLWIKKDCLLSQFLLLRYSTKFTKQFYIDNNASLNPSYFDLFAYTLKNAGLKTNQLG